MPEERKPPEVPERATAATTRSLMVPLNEFVLMPELYCHRDSEELKDRERLLPLMDSITIDGQQTAVEYFVDPNGRKIVTKGNRRISAMRQAADENRPGFSPTMLVKAEEVFNATPHDLLCRAVAENTAHKFYSKPERMRAAKALSEGGVEANRAAYALGYGIAQYLRDALIAKHAWLFEYYEKNAIGHTAAGVLIDAATKANHVADLKQYLDSWIAAKKEELKAAGQDVAIKGFIGESHYKHWSNLLPEGKPLNDNFEPPSDRVATFYSKAKVIEYGGKADLLNDDLPTLARKYTSVSESQEVLLTYLKRRHAVENGHGVGSDKGSQSGQDVLEKEGLADLLKAGEAPDSTTEDDEPGAAPAVA